MSQLTTLKLISRTVAKGGGHTVQFQHPTQLGNSSDKSTIIYNTLLQNSADHSIPLITQIITGNN